MQKKFLKNTEWGILICSVLLLIIGMVALFSATQNSDYEEFKKQGIWFLISIPILIIVTIIDYSIIAKLSPYFYGIFIILLIAVLFTESINGATSWFNLGIFSFQPAEFAKIFVILFSAYILEKLCSHSKKEINTPWKLAIIILIVAVPTLLIVKQPDYGTAIAFMVAFAFMLFISRNKNKIYCNFYFNSINYTSIIIFICFTGTCKNKNRNIFRPRKRPKRCRIQCSSV